MVLDFGAKFIIMQGQFNIKYIIFDMTQLGITVYLSQHTYIGSDDPMWQYGLNQ